MYRLGKTLVQEGNFGVQQQNRMLLLGHLNFPDVLGPMTDILIKKKGNIKKFDQKIDAILRNIVNNDFFGDRRRHTEAWTKFVYAISDPAVTSFDEAIMTYYRNEDNTLDQDSITRLLQSMVDGDPLDNPIRMEPKGSGPYIRMHVGKYSLHPAAQFIKMREGIQEKRQQEPEYDPAIYTKMLGFSWLLNDQFGKYIDKFGLDPANIDRAEINIQDLLSHPKQYDFSGFGINCSYIVSVALHNALSSRQNMKDFITTLKLPNIGIMMMNTKDFYQTAA
jgi:hypothetical protein